MTLISNSTQRTHEWTGFTLIELLAVLSIMAMTAVITLVGLTQADDRAQLQRFAGALQQLDRQARLQSRDGALDIAVHEDPSTVLLRRIDSGVIVNRIRIPVDANVRYQSSDKQAIDSVRIERAGRSRDYRVHVKLGAHRTGWKVAGLTGYITKQEVLHE